MNQQLSTPKGFILDEIHREFNYSEDKIASVWKKLQSRETFTKGQLFPYRVEFASASQEGEFSPGELNIHHGPFLSVHGAIGEVTPTYRSLNYFYGSYVISFRLVRPIQLEFYQQGNKLKLNLRAYIKPWFKPLWRLLNLILWACFRLTLR